MRLVTFSFLAIVGVLLGCITVNAQTVPPNYQFEWLQIPYTPGGGEATSVSSATYYSPSNCGYQQYCNIDDNYSVFGGWFRDYLVTDINCLISNYSANNTVKNGWMIKLDDQGNSIKTFIIETNCSNCDLTVKSVSVNKINGDIVLLVRSFLTGSAEFRVRNVCNASQTYRFAGIGVAPNIGTGTDGMADYIICLDKNGNYKWSNVILNSDGVKIKHDIDGSLYLITNSSFTMTKEIQCYHHVTLPTTSSLTDISNISYPLCGLG